MKNNVLKAVKRNASHFSWALHTLQQAEEIPELKRAGSWGSVLEISVSPTLP